MVLSSDLKELLKWFKIKRCRLALIKNFDLSWVIIFKSINNTVFIILSLLTDFSLFFSLILLLKFLFWFYYFCMISHYFLVWFYFHFDWFYITLFSLILLMDLLQQAWTALYEVNKELNFFQDYSQKTGFFSWKKIYPISCHFHFQKCGLIVLCC